MSEFLKKNSNLIFLGIVGSFLSVLTVFRNKKKETTYTQKNKIPELFDDLTKDLEKNKPENHLNFIIERLEELNKPKNVYFVLGII
jgi:hypothetical protein